MVSFKNPDACPRCETKKGDVIKGCDVKSVFYQIDVPVNRYLVCNFCSAMYEQEPEPSNKLVFTTYLVVDHVVDDYNE